MGAGTHVKVCLVTPGQPSSNPRLVKEADALVEAGYDVHVIASYFTDWATERDRSLMASRRWTLTFIDWRASVAPALFHFSRIRHFAARQLAARAPGIVPLAIPALARAGPELLQATMRVDADLYVAHNLAALPIVVKAAAAKSALAAFDAEDFHSGQMLEAKDARAVAFVRAIERAALPSCAYVTAAAPGIAEAYRTLYGVKLPTTILNLFPLRDRPQQPRRLDECGPLRLYWFSQTIGPDRGLEHVVEAVANLGQHPIELHLRGTWQSGYEAELRGRAARQGLDPRCIVHHPTDAPDEMVRLAAAFDVGLATEPCATPNNSLLLSNKIFTYLLAGLAVVATRTPGQSRLTPEIDRATAWCEPGSPASLAAALGRWAGDRVSLREARAEAWRLGTERFNWDVERKRYLEIVAAALGATGRRARSTSADRRESLNVAGAVPPA